MTVRRWVSENINSEGTPRWGLAYTTKYLVEGGLAVILAGIPTLLVLAMLLVREFSLPFGVAGPVGLWLVLSGLVFMNFTHCTYTNLS